MSPSPAIFDRRQLTRQLGLLAVLAILYLGGIWLRQEQASPNQQEAIPLLELLASRPLVITRHGQCRMDCREISLTEIRQALTDGHLNTEKSEPDDQPCPTWAVESNTPDGQHIRVIFAACDRETRVVTAIDLDRDHACSCE